MKTMYISLDCLDLLWNLSCVVLPQLFALEKNTKGEHVMENKKVKPTTPNKEK